MINKKKIVPRQQVLLFNSRLKLFLGKLWSRWIDPYTVNLSLTNRAIELITKDEQLVLFNGQRVKHDFCGTIYKFCEKQYLKCKVIGSEEDRVVDEGDENIEEWNLDNFMEKNICFYVS